MGQVDVQDKKMYILLFLQNDTNLFKRETDTAEWKEKQKKYIPIYSSPSILLKDWDREAQTTEEYTLLSRLSETIIM